VFTARYALSPYIKQIRFVFTGLMDYKPAHILLYALISTMLVPYLHVPHPPLHLHLLTFDYTVHSLFYTYTHTHTHRLTHTHIHTYTHTHIQYFLRTEPFHLGITLK
jgi:hypothetical protein